MTTVTFDEETQVLTLDQAAEKDQKHTKSSKLVLEATEESMTMTYETEDGTKAVRTLVKHRPHSSKDGIRKISAPF